MNKIEKSAKNLLDTLGSEQINSYYKSQLYDLSKTYMHPDNLKKAAFYAESAKLALEIMPINHPSIK